MKKYTPFLLLIINFLLLNVFCDSARADNSFIVLNYPKVSFKKTHNYVCKKSFLKQMRYLKDNGFTSLGIDDLNAMFYQKKALPLKSVLLIFSGGQRQTYEVVNPILKKLNFKAVFILNLKNMQERNTYYVSWHDLIVMNREKRWDFGILAKDDNQILEQLNYFSKKFKDISLKTIIIASQTDEKIIPPNFKIAFKRLSGYLYNSEKSDPLDLNYVNVTSSNNLKIINFLADIYIAKNELKLAIKELDKSLKIDNSQEKVRLKLAKAYFQDREYSKSELVYRKLIEKSPSDARYRMGLASCLYREDRCEEALLIVESILKDDPNNLSALKFKANNYFYNQDLINARKMLKDIYRLIPDNLGILNKLITVNFELKNYDEAAEFARQSLSIDSGQAAILLLYADSLRFRQKFNEAKEQYGRAVLLNPNNILAKVGIMNLYIDSKQYNKAIQISDELISLDKTNVNYYIAKAKILAYHNKYRESENILFELSKKYANEQRFLILLYHGLSNRERDDILKVKDFRLQMQALKDAGFEPISLRDLRLAYEGKIILPEKSVLITFDDARQDSFKLATPILKEFKFKAVMFTPVSFMKEDDSFFSSYKDLLIYQNSGYWDIQSHGDLAHQSIVVDDSGREALFLTNKKWLGDRFENDEEFGLRIENDYLDSKEALQKNLKNDIYAYAFPVGSFGQQDFSNFNQAPNKNLKLVKKYYRFSFIQDNSGFNFISSDPYLLKRFSIGFDLNIEDFKEHIISFDPKLKIDVLRKNINRWQGGNKKVEIKPVVSYFNDSNHRSNLKLSNYLTVRPFYNFSFTPFYSKIYLEEKGEGKIHEDEYGLGLTYRSAVNSYLAEILYKDYSSKYGKINYSLGYKTKFGFFDSFWINSSLKNIERLNAVRAKITAYENFIALSSNLPIDFILSGKYQYGDYNDKNQRQSARMSLSHLIWKKLGVYFGYEYFYDDAKIDSNNYYSPQKLMMNNFRFRLVNSFFDKKMYYDLSYILGYGKEKTSKNRLTNSFDGSVTYKIKDNLEASVIFNISKTPTYHSSTTTGQFRYSF